MEVSKSSSAFGYRPNQQGMCLSDLFSRCWQTSLVLSHYIGPVVCMWLERLHSFLNEGCMKVGIRNEWMKCYWNIQITASAVFMIKCVTNSTILWRCREAGFLDMRHYECDFNSLFSANNDDHGNMIIPPHCKWYHNGSVCQSGVIFNIFWWVTGNSLYITVVW